MRRIVKATSVILIASFSYSQIVWAIDVRQMLLDAKAAFDAEDTRRSSADLQTSQTQQQTVIAQQQALQDLQTANFSLTTPSGDVLQYVGSKLSEVKRPDGTELNSITQDVNGNITNADLKLSDGSVQLYQNGSVIGYQSPDGSQVIYSGGQIQKVFSKNGVETDYTYVKDVNGNVTETDLDNPTYQSKYDANGKIKESTRKSDGQKTVYSNGMIQKIVHPDGTQESFTWTAQGTDTVVAAQVSLLNTYTDAQGNIFTFATDGSISQVKLPDNSILTNITWDAQNKINNATLTDSASAKYTYQNKVLTMSTTSSGVVTNYTYSSNTITAASAGNTWVYDLNKNPLSYTDLYGNSTTYLTSGAYKGLRDRDTMATGQVFVYEYSGSGSAITVQKREFQSTMYNIVTFDGQTFNAQSTNPAFRTTVQFPNDGTLDQSVVVTAVNSAATKKLTLNLVSGAGSTYTWAGVATSLGVTLNKGTDYKVQLAWETGRVGIYVYAASSTKPSTPTKSITDRSWDPKFKSVATNTTMTFDATSSGYYGQANEIRDKSYVFLPGSPVFKTDITPVVTSYHNMYFQAVQWVSTSLTRKYECWFENGTWTFTQTDTNSTTGVKISSTSSSLVQAYTNGKTYAGEFRAENGKMNLYIYDKALAKPATPLFSFAAYNVNTMIMYTSYNNPGRGAEYKNLTTPTYASSQATALTSRTDTIKNLTLTKASQPQGSTSTVDFSSITYDSSANVKQILMKDGSKLIFANGLLTQALDPLGNPTTFNFSQSALSNLTGSEIVQNNLTSDYDATGKLSQVKVNGLTIKYKSDGSGVDSIQKEDGTTLSNLTFDVSGKITGSAIVTPDGQTRTYSAGQLVDLRQADQSEILYANAKPAKLITPEKITYNFDYTNPAIIQAVMDASITNVNALTPVKMQYDTNFNLTKVIRQNNEVLNYLNTSLTEIDPPSGAPEVFAYQKDASGNILSYTVTQGNVQTFYDASNNPTKAVISPTSDNSHTFLVTYQYGKIRQITKDGVITFNYSYTFDANNNEITNIDDLATNTFKTYQDGNLITSQDKATSVLSSYSYSGGNVSQVQVSRLGRILHTYAYGYAGSMTIVQDEEGTFRTYDSNQNLVYLEKDGQKFAYAQVTQSVATGSYTETVLPLGLYDTTAQSVLPWDGSQGWFSWERQWGKDYLVTYWWDQWVEYKPTTAQNGDLKINLEAINDGALPANFANFQLDVSVDGQSKGLFGVPASASTWQTAAILLKNIVAGTHTVRLKFANFFRDSAGQSSFKFRSISFKQEVPVFTQEQVVTEKLIQKKLSDGSVALYDNSGKVTEIDKPDGSFVKNILTDASGNITEAITYANSADLVGTHFYFSTDGISKVTTPDGKTLNFSYDKDSSGNIVTTWIQKGAVLLKYNGASALSALKLFGVLDPNQIAQSAVHAYQGGANGPMSFDGNFSTAQSASASQSFGQTQGSVSVNIYSTHTFTQPQTITALQYRMAASGSGWGDYSNNNHASGYADIEYQLSDGIWRSLAGTVSGMGDTGPVAMALTLDGVTTIRAYANGYGSGSDHGGCNAGASIYEIQYTLADLADLSFTANTNSSGQTTGFTVSGYKGSIAFDTAGNLTLSNANYAAVQQELTGAIQNLAAFPYENSNFDTARTAILDSQSVIASEYSTDGTLQTQTKADGTVTLFDNNKPSEVLDAQGNILIQYTYDANGNPTRVYLKNARDTLPGQVLKAKQSIEDQRDQNLLTLAQQRSLAYQSIQSQVASQKSALQAQIQDLQNQFNNVSNTSVSGKKAKSQRGDALNQIGNAIANVQSALITLESQEADGYASLDASVKAVSDKIESDAQSAYATLATQEASMKQEILRQEVSPIVYDYYRRILGRDPDTNEYNYWIGKIDYVSGNTPGETKTTDNVNLTAALNTYISALPELSDRQTYVNTIKTNVAAAINNYLAMTDTQKQAFAATLGLTPADLVNLSSTDAGKILSWLNSRSLHFGQSAFLALESLLDQKGITYTRTDVAQKVILVDILTGVMTPLDDGDPVLSVFALKKVASVYGVAMDGAKINWDDLLSFYTNNPQSKVVTLVNSSHFVVITAVTATSVTYVDTGAGKDKQNQSFTVSKNDFLKIWQGNVILENQKIQSQNLTSKVLSADQQKSLRGACWFIFAAIFSAIANIGGAIWAVVNGIGTILSAVGTVVGNALTAVGQALSSLGQGLSYIGKSLFEGIKLAASTVFNAGKQLFGSIAEQFSFGSLTKASFGDIVFQNAARTGFSAAITKGLEALGVNATISNLAGAFVSGGITTTANTAFNAQSFIQNGVKTLALTASQNLVQRIGIDPTLSQTVSLVTSALVDGIQTGTVGTQLVKIIPSLTKDLTLYGVDKLGTSIGLPTSLSNLISLPISNALASTFTQTQWSGQVSSTEQNDITIDASQYYDESQHQNIFIPGPGTPDRTWWDNAISFLKNLLPGAIQAAIGAYYAATPKISTGSSNTQIVTTALPLPNGATPLNYQDVNGNVRQGYQISTGANSYLVYDRLTGFVVKRVTNGVIEEGKFEYRIIKKIDGTYSLDFNNPMYLSQGTITYNSAQGGKAFFKISDKNVQEIRIDATASDVVLDSGTTKDTSNKIINGTIHFLALDLDLFVNNSQVSKQVGGNSLSSQDLTRSLLTAFIFGNGFNNVVVPTGTPDSLMPPFISNLVSDRVVNALRTFLVTMYGPTNLVGNLLQWFSNYVTPNLSIDPDVSRFVTMLNEPGFFINLMLNYIPDSVVPAAIRSGFVDFKNNYNAYFGGVNKSLYADVVKQLSDLEKAEGPIADGIAFAHSGFFEPLLKAIQTTKSDGTQYDIQTIINYEGPYWLSHSDTINNPNLKRIINVWGTATLLGDGDLGPPTWSFANDHFQGPPGSNIDNINIQIEGAFHNDFSYNPNDYADHTEWDAKKAERQIINRRVNLFMRDLYQAALNDQTNPGLLDDFFVRLERSGAAKLENGVWKIDPDQLRDIQLS